LISRLEFQYPESDFAYDTNAPQQMKNPHQCFTLKAHRDFYTILKNILLVLVEIHGLSVYSTI
jgi:hypothetical protein